MISFKQYITEGILDFFKKKKEPNMQELTADQRKHISKHFPNSNVNLKFGKSETSRHVLTHNAHTTHGSLRISFRNEDGKLKASVAHHNSHTDAVNQKVVPITHTDHTAETDSDMEHIKALSK